MSLPITDISANKFAHIAYQLNSLIDKGEILELEDVEELLHKGGILSWLETRYGQLLDLSLVRRDPGFEKMEAHFRQFSMPTELGVSENGLCLLLALCIDGMNMATR